MRQGWGLLDEFAGLLAHHWEAAGQPVEAAMHLQRAARWIAKTDSAQALGAWKRVRWLLRNEPHTETVDRLRQVASGQVLGLGWREGMTAGEAKPYAEEALRYARKGGEKMQLPLLLGGYGRILAASGAADDYVALVREALAFISEENDAGRTAAVRGMLSQAYLFAGLLKDALAASDAAMATIAERHDLDGGVVLGLSVRQILGFDVAHWVKSLRTRILVGLGRFREAEVLLADVLSTDADQVNALTQFIPHFSLVEMAWHHRQPDLADRHAAQVAEYADQLAVPYLRIAALVCAGLALTTKGDFAGAARTLQEGIDLARRAKAGLEYEPCLLASLADVRYRSGEFGAALKVAAEAFDVARRRTHRAAQLHACIVLAAARTATGAGGGNEARALIEKAGQLMGETGAVFFAPLLADVQTRMKSTREEFRELDAEGGTNNGRLYQR